MLLPEGDLGVDEVCACGGRGGGAAQQASLFWPGFVGEWKVPVGCAGAQCTMCGVAALSSHRKRSAADPPSLQSEAMASLVHVSGGGGTRRAPEKGCVHEGGVWRSRRGLMDRFLPRDKPRTRPRRNAPGAAHNPGERSAVQAAAAYARFAQGGVERAAVRRLRPTKVQAGNDRLTISTAKGHGALLPALHAARRRDVPGNKVRGMRS